MLYHYTFGFIHPAPGPPFVAGLGVFGVEMFFIISGFVIFMTVERTRSIRDFAVARFARLYPSFLAAVVVAQGAALLSDSAPFAMRDFLANSTMVPQLFGVAALDRSYWSLLYELDFYVLAAVFCLGFGCRRPEALCTIWLLLALTARMTASVLNLVPVVALTAMPFANLFTIGIVLCRIHTRQARSSTWILLALALSMTIFGPAMGFWWGISAELISTSGYAGLILGFTGLVWFASSRHGDWLAIAPLRFLGRVSYPLYLVHQAAGFVAMTYLERAGCSPALAIGITICLAVAAAWGISAGIEYPAQRWLRARFSAAPAPIP